MKKTGDEYFDSKEFIELLTTYEEAVNSGQPVFLDAEELAEIADYYQMTDQLDKADEAINMALSLSPGSIAPLTYKIHEALYNNDVEKAEGYLEQIVETDDPDYLYNKIEIMLAKEQYDQADQLLHEAYDTIPAEERQDFLIDIARIYQDYNMNEKSLEWMKLAQPEESIEYKELKANALFGTRHFRDSGKLYNELIDEKPFSSYYWNGLAASQFMDEDYSNAIQSSEYAIAIDPNDPEALITKANSLLNIENYEESAKFYQRYLDIYPDDELALTNLAKALIHLDRNEEAVEKLENAISVAPEDSPVLGEIYQELALTYSENGNLKRAIDCLDKTKDIDCDHAEIEVLKGHIYLSAGMRKDAQKHFQKAIEESDSVKQTILHVIVSFYDNKYTEIAHKLFVNYFEDADESLKDGYAYMALCCYDMKHDKEFLYYLEEACKRNPRECKIVLSHLFPEDLKPELYYDYLMERMKN